MVQYLPSWFKQDSEQLDQAEVAECKLILRSGRETGTTSRVITLAITPAVADVIDFDKTGSKGYDISNSLGTSAVSITASPRVRVVSSL